MPEQYYIDFSFADRHANGTLQKNSPHDFDGVLDRITKTGDKITVEQGKKVNGNIIYGYAAEARVETYNLSTYPQRVDFTSRFKFDDDGQPELGHFGFIKPTKEPALWFYLTKQQAENLPAKNNGDFNGDGIKDEIVDGSLIGEIKTAPYVITRPSRRW